MNITRLDYILNNIFNAYDFFLLEVYAIPKETRKEYLNKLLNRKDAGSQKNVRFLKYIYSILEGNSYKEWNEEALCKKLEISRRMLDCHKSRLLKSMREYYFGWEERAKRLEEGIKGDEIDRLVATGNEMSRIGMIKEAKHVYFKAEGKINKILSKDPSEKNYIYLADIYRRLSLYYFLQRDARKFNLYKAKCDKLLKSALKRNFSVKTLTALKIRQLRTEYWKLKFNTPSDKNVLKSKSILEEILKEAGKISDYENMLFALDNLGGVYMKLRNLDKAEELIKEGLFIAEGGNLHNKSIVFEILMDLIKFRKNNKTAKSFLKKLEKAISILSNSECEYEDLKTVKYNYIRMLIFFNREGSDSAAENFINDLILYSNKADAISKWYLELSDRLSSSIYTWHGIMTGADEFQLDINVNKKLLEMFEEMNYNTLIHYNKFYDPETLAVLYLNQIDLEFWKGTACNFENAHYFIKKLDRLIKTRHIGINKSWFISSKIGIKIFEDMNIMPKKDVFDKHFVTVKEFIDSIKDEKRSFNIADELAKLIFISKKLNVKRFIYEVKNLEAWLKSNHPEHYRAIVNAAEIESKGYRVA